MPRGRFPPLASKSSISGEKLAKLTIGIRVVLHRDLLAYADVWYVRPRRPRGNYRTPPRPSL